MSEPESGQTRTQQNQAQRALQRRKRQAEALRANLRRRKEVENTGPEAEASGNIVQNDPDSPNT